MLMMQNVLWVETIEKLEILANETRAEIIDLLRFKPYSPMRLSKRMGVSAQKLNYHFKLLYENGFIYKKYEEKKRGAFESFYQPIAHVFKVNQSIFNDVDMALFSSFQFIEVLEKKMSDSLNLFPKENPFSCKHLPSKAELISYIQSLPDSAEFYLVHSNSRMDSK